MKRNTIAITGLQNAGKTSFSQRLVTGKYITSQPTFGVDVEFTQYNGLPIQIWDMGGHESFRKHIWRNYVNQSSALIFIFDASDFSKMNESVEWFWNCYSWVADKEIPILFLANKWDLVKDQNATMETIVKEFRLNEISIKAINTPFRFFFISVKSGAYISEAMNWLVLKHLLNKQRQQNNILSFDVFIKFEDYVAHLHDNTESRKIVMDAIDVYKKKWINSNSSLLNVLEEINFNGYKVLFISYPEKAILVSTKTEFIEKGIFGEIIEKLETVEISEDINNLHILLEKAKSELEKYFQSDISASLSCDYLQQQLVSHEQI
jgi:small GTP-binding protein